MCVFYFKKIQFCSLTIKHIPWVQGRREWSHSINIQFILLKWTLRYIRKIDSHTHAHTLIHSFYTWHCEVMGISKVKVLLCRVNQMSGCPHVHKGTAIISWLSEPFINPNIPSFLLQMTSPNRMTMIPQKNMILSNLQACSMDPLQPVSPLKIHFTSMGKENNVKKDKMKSVWQTVLCLSSSLQ